MDNSTLAEIRAGEAALGRTVRSPRRAVRRTVPPPVDIDEDDEDDDDDYWAAVRRMRAERLARTRRQIQAERVLTQWAATMRQRDEQVRAAVAAGVSIRSVQRITGIARSTITRIVAGIRISLSHASPRLAIPDEELPAVALRTRTSKKP